MRKDLQFCEGIKLKKEMIEIFQINHIDYSAAVFRTNLTKINSNNMEDL